MTALGRGGKKKDERRRGERKMKEERIQKGGRGRREKGGEAWGWGR
jgi:hypothetical protein